MKVVVADHKNLETHSLITRFVRIFSVPLLNNLPSSIIKKLMKASSHDAATVVDHVGSTYALEVMYTRYHRGLLSRGIFQGFADLFWHHCVSQPKAVRNRLKIVEKNLRSEILKIVAENKKQENIVILTIGGGSARGVIQSISELAKKNLGHRIEVINVDKSRKAIEVSKKIAREFNLYNHFKWINKKAQEIKFLVPKNSVDIVEMVGLLDYFSDKKGIEVMKQIYSVLKKRGLFITGNIYPNPEVSFINKMGWPNMYYRTPDDLSKILELSGFSSKNVQIILEPLKSHIIVTARK